MSHHTIILVVNGERQEARVPARRLLSDFLRDDLHLTGTKRGCETGVCGACSVLVDGEVVKSCLSLAVQADGCIRCRTPSCAAAACSAATARRAS